MSLTTSNPPLPARWHLPPAAGSVAPAGAPENKDLKPNPERDKQPVASEHDFALLDGFRVFMHFLVEQEADYLCGASPCMRTPARTNYRSGYYTRKFRTSIGEFPLRVPNLLYFVPRTSVIKRAKRLAPEILDILSRIYSGSASVADSAALIKTAWTLELSDDLLIRLASQLVPILEHWRLRALLAGPRVAPHSDSAPPVGPLFLPPTH